MISIVLRILLLFILWWAALWLALPVEWLQGGLFSFALLHLLPPLSVIGVWNLFKRARVWYAARMERIAAGKEATEHKNQQDAAQSAQQKTQAHRQSYIECRAVWAAVLKTPTWHDGKPERVRFIEQNAKALDADLYSSLEQVLAELWARCPACAYLPVILADDPDQAEWIERIWSQIAAASPVEEQCPAQLDCRNLPGSGALAERLITLFESDSDLPAALLLGMGSSLWNPDEKYPGQAVVLVLVSRPGLSIPEGAEPDDGSDVEDVMRPFWERRPRQEKDDSLWGRIPLYLRRDLLLEAPPFAALHRPVTAELLPGMKRDARVQCVRAAVGEAFVNAALAGNAEPPEPGWLVHDSDDLARFSAISVALSDFELNPIGEASKLLDEFGNVGAAREALILAVGLIRAAQLRKPVLLAGSGEGAGIALGVSKAVEIPADEPKAVPQKILRYVTSDLCPQTGWWLCIETDKRVRIIKGQIMPSVRYERPTTGTDSDMDAEAGTIMGPGIWAWIGVTGDENIEI